MAESEPTVAVIGAAGYIGSRVVVDLQETHPEWTVRGLDNFYLGTVDRIGDITIEDVDIRYREQLEAALSGADIVMHLAAISGVDDCTANPDLAYEVNVQGTNNVAWWCRKHGAGLVYPFSVGVIGDPKQYPITTDHPRDPLNWYARTKLLTESAIDGFAEGAFPAHLFMKANLYGHHTIDGRTITKNMVINFFIDRALSGETLTVYAPGTQSRNYVHVNDVSMAYVKSAERLVEALEAGETGAREYEIASDEDTSVIDVAERVQAIAAEEHGLDVDVEVVENPREAETLVDNFRIDTSKPREELGWEAAHSIDETIRNLLQSE
jgi:UDP-glucose 4-epimerase